MFTKKANKSFVGNRNNGSVLVLVSVVVLMVSLLGLGILTAAYGARRRASNLRHQTMSELAAEAGYEKAIQWLNNQTDVLSGMAAGGMGGGGTEATRKIKSSSTDGHFGRGGFDYTINFDRFLGTQPIYKIVSEGYFGLFRRRIESTVVQAVNGWDMGLCEIPSGSWSARRAWFTGEDIIEMPMHINTEGTPEDGTVDIDVRPLDPPQFDYQISMGESRYTWWGHNKDKYNRLMPLFKKGIYFDQPRCNVTDPESMRSNMSVKEKVARFKRNTLGKFNFSGINAPLAESVVALADESWEREPAVQLEFYVSGVGAGMVRITNNCTVCCAEGAGNDYILDSAQVNPYTPYPIYGYHYADNSQSVEYSISSTYVRQQVYSPGGRVSSATSGGQLFVKGNVIIGGAVGVDPAGNMVMAGTRLYSKLKGRLMVVATGNIWIVHPIVYAGPQEPSEYEGGNLTKLVPSMDNENVLGLFSQFGAVKIIDPQLSSAVPVNSSNPNIAEVYTNAEGSFLTYQPVGFQAALSSSEWERQLVDPSQMTASIVVQAAITSCGGGWGAENIGIPALGARQNVNPMGKDILIVAGSLTESVQGIVASGDNGFRRCYYFDERLLTGILPGDMWLQSKYVPTPGGWSDFRL